MKCLATVLASLCLFIAAQAFAATASFTLPAAATTSAGIYDSNGVLVRTLWSNVHYNAGTYTANWNGLDDLGVLRPNGSYALRVLSNNVQYTWEGAIGNNSDFITGTTVHHGLDTYYGIAVTDASIYVTAGYNEQLPPGYKLNRATPHQRQKKVLGRTTRATHVVTDGTNVYWSATDPYAATKYYVLVTKISDDTEATLSGATTVTMAWAPEVTYHSVIDPVSGTGSTITGLAVQKAGPFLFVARAALNQLDVVDKTTGVVVKTLTTYTAPGALTVDAADNLWMVTNTTLVTKYGVSTAPGATYGTLTALGNLTGLSKPLALAVSPTGSELVVADGGTSQQLKGYSTSTFGLLATLGLAGGYANGPAVTDNKFFFKNTRVDVQQDWAYLGFEPEGNLWLGDPGNSRVLRFDTTATVIDRIQFMPSVLGAKVDQNNPTRVFGQYLEFSVDYSKPLSPTNGSWTLVRNWGWNVPANNWDETGFRTITTLPAYGRTFALSYNAISSGMEVVELPASGNARFTGKFTDSRLDALDKNGALRWQSRACDYPSYNPAGTQITWKKRDLTSLDASNNPVWGSQTTVASSPVLSTHEVCNNVTSGSKPWEITSTGVLLAFEDLNIPLADWHLQGLDTTTGQWKFRAAPATNHNYMGPYPPEGYFDVGNNNFSPYAGGSYHASGRNIFWQYHGEGWKQGQTNKWMHLYDDGLVIGQFGVVSPTTDGPLLGEAAAGFAGNAFSSAIVTAADGSLYIWHNDDGQHGGLNRWHATGLDSIHEDSISITLANPLQSGLQGTYYDDKSLSNLKPLTVRIDPTVDFNWGTSAPSGTALSHADNYSVRWQGFVKPRYSETYTFYTSSDDGVRLWVDNVLVVDHWQNQTATEWSGTVKLDADKLYQVRLEYYQLDTTASAQLSWSSTSQAKEIVPSSRLFFTDVAPSFSGLNLQDALWYNVDEVSDDLYGWHRSPAANITNDWLNDWWSIETSRYVYRKDMPVDIRANFARNGTASLWRDLRPAGASTVSAWTVSGKLAYGDNPNRDEYNPAGGDNIGQYLEVLDDTGKIIARLYPRGNWPANQIAINANGPSTPVKVVSMTAWHEVIKKVPTPFSIHGESGQIDFAFADGTLAHASLYDPTANWQKPTTLRIYFFHFRNNYAWPVDSSLSEVIFTTAP